MYLTLDEFTALTKGHHYVVESNGAVYIEGAFVGTLDDEARSVLSH